MSVNNYTPTNIWYITDNSPASAKFIASSARSNSLEFVKNGYMEAYHVVAIPTALITVPRTGLGSRATSDPVTNNTCFGSEGLDKLFQHAVDETTSSRFCCYN
jgi:hypothetical protein